MQNKNCEKLLRKDFISTVFIIYTRSSVKANVIMCIRLTLLSVLLNEQDTETMESPLYLIFAFHDY